VDPNLDWHRVARLVLTSRAIDHLEETRLVPEKKVLYQFSARGHDVAQVILGSFLTGERDGAGAYYRSRPLLLTLGLSLEDAIAGPMGKSGGFSDGRDIGVVCNLPSPSGAVVLPMSGDVGSQYTPTSGWAEAIVYRSRVLKDERWRGSIAVALGGEASVATNGFWSALTMATTLQLPVLFCIEDNGYGISVPSDKQTPGANIARNLASFSNLSVRDGDGTDPAECVALARESVEHVRGGKGPALLRLTVPRLSGHSGQDTQAYKPPELIEAERKRDPLPRLREYLVPAVLSEKSWKKLEREVEAEVEQALQRALARPEPDGEQIRRHVFAERGSDGRMEAAQLGGMFADDVELPAASEEPKPDSMARVNMEEAIRRTLAAELRSNPRVRVFGEDVGAKGGVHGITKGLQAEFGEERVYDTSLSEEGIIGRAVGMAIGGLVPVAEIQFRKYADPATEQLNNCGTMRWRTCNRFAAPIIVRMPGGFGRWCGDPWHSVNGEVMWAHAVGWQVAFPSNAEDAAGLLRAAMRSPNPTIFFEHRYLVDAPAARRPYPGDDFILPLGQARVVTEGDDLSVVTWGAMVERCERAAEEIGGSIEILDLRTIAPWDREAVLRSVEKTNRCLIVHEDTLTAGFGAEIAAVLTQEAFFHLDAPVQRVAIPDVPTPYNPDLMNAVVPDAQQIAAAMRSVLSV
jgi:2-oxoisovalerate dehydrogenase E1 component